MKQLITIALLLCSTWVFGQTVTTPPSGSKGYGTPVATPSGEILVGRSGSYTYVTRKAYTDSLIALGWNKAQIDSAILAQIALIAFPVTSVNGETGAVMLDAADIGLGNVDNTSDSNKPISTATQSALDGKENTFSKGNLVAGTNVTLSGTLSNRLVGSGNVTINAANSLTASNGLQINSANITPIYGTTSNTVAQGNDSRINNGQTAFGWGDYRQFGLGTDGVLITDMTDADRFDRQSSIMRATSGANVPFGSLGVGINMSYSSTRSAQMWFNLSSLSPQFRVSTSSNNWSSIYTFWTSQNYTPPVVFTRSDNGLVPAPGGSGTTRYLREDGSWVDPSTGGGGGTATDLSIQNRTSTTLQVGSSTGTAATVPIATTSLGGLMSAADKVKLNGLANYTEGDGITISSGTISANFGSSSTTVARGNDSRINNGQTAFSWGNHALGKYVSAVPTTSTGMTIDDYNGNLDDLYTGFAFAGTSATNKPGSGNGSLITMRQSSSVAAQMYAYAGGDQWLVRKNQAGTWSSWYQLWHNGNFNPSDYLTTANFTWSGLSGKPSTFAPSAHNHNASDINAGTLAIARIPTGTTGSTVALGNHTHAFSAITSKPTTLSGYGITDAVPTSRTINGKGLSSSVTLTASDVSAVPISGNATVSGTKTFSSPVVSPQYQGTATTASSSIATNAQSLFTASVSSNTSYTLTNLTGNPRHIQVMVTNTSGSNITVSFNASLPVNQTNTVFAGSTAIFTFLINNGAAYGTKTQY